MHGTDIGSGLASRLAGLFPQRVIGTHLGVDRAVLGVGGDARRARSACAPYEPDARNGQAAHPSGTDRSVCRAVLRRPAGVCWAGPRPEAEPSG